MAPANMPPYKSAAVAGVPGVMISKSNTSLPHDAAPAQDDRKRWAHPHVIVSDASSLRAKAQPTKSQFKDAGRQVEGNLYSNDDSPNVQVNVDYRQSTQRNASLSLPMSKQAACGL